MPSNGNGGSKPLWFVDGQFSWEAGIDSGRVPTIASQEFPEGLKRTQLAFAGNAVMRGGKISGRPGYQPLVSFAAGTKAPWSGLFQGAYLYQPDGGNPYIMMGVGGRTWQVRVDTDNSIHDQTGSAVMPANQPYWWFEQGEQFLVIQDSVSPPRVWDGTTLKTGPATTSLPIGTAMDYFMGRMWVCTAQNQREFTAGDIVRGPSGTLGYGLRDSILRMTENAYLTGGGAFVVPTSDGIVRGIFHTSELDTTLGQGNLYVGTRKTIYRMNVPVTRTDWIATTNANLPLQTVALIKNGPVNDRSIVGTNADVFFQSLEPAIRSLTLASRYFQQWGNTQISRNENRVLQFNDRSLLHSSSGIEFNNRLLQTALPFQTPVGVAHKGLIPLDFDLISSLGEKYPPAWEGMWEGLSFLQLLEGDFGGLQRAFAIVLSQVSNQIEVWEISTNDIRDNGDNQITYFFETPAYTCGKLKELKRLVSGELWIDELFGTADITVEWRVDQNQCWNLWTKFQECSARDCREADTSCLYPIQPLCPQNRAPLKLPKPQQPAACDVNNSRPSDIGYQFQCRVTVKGTASVRGFFIYCEPFATAAYYGLVC